MGELPQILALLNGSGMSNADILAIVNPPADQRNRSLQNRYSMPGQDAWRMTPSVGRPLDKNTQKVHSNHFLVPTNNIPGRMYVYHVHIKKFDRDGNLIDTDIAAEEDCRITTLLMSNWKQRHPEWQIHNGKPSFFTYDSKSKVVSCHPLPFGTVVNSINQPYFEEILDLHANVDNVDQPGRKFKLSLTLVDQILTPPNNAWPIADANVLAALETVTLSFAKNQQCEDLPEWYIVGSKVFRANSESYPLERAYVAMRGYYASLKVCMAGLVLVSDMSVSVFLSGGSMIDVMWRAAGFNSFQDMLQAANSPSGINKRDIERMNEAIKNSKIRIIHTNQSRKAKSIGPPANHRDSKFEWKTKGISVTVADYFTEMAKTNNNYREHLTNGRLKFPTLPCINIGTSTNMQLVPCELIMVSGGQSRAQHCTPEMTATLIRQAAVRPDERQKYIIGDVNSSVVNILQRDATSKTFGLSTISPSPIVVQATLLPQAKISYGGNKEVDPGLSGGWNINAKEKFVRYPPNPLNGAYKYGILLVSNAPPRNEVFPMIQEFEKGMIADSVLSGAVLTAGGPPVSCQDSESVLKQKLKMMKDSNVRIVFVMMMVPCYERVKYAADMMGLITQCLKWKHIERPPRGYFANVMLKVNTKLGGTNHTLRSRLPGAPSSRQPTYQDPPASLSWIFDKPCMLVGIDVSHAEAGSNRKSMAAVVASMNGQASQYVAQISAQETRLEMVSQLEDIMKKHFDTFKSRNSGRMPEHVLVYRDGVADGQFEQVLQRELPAIRGAAQLCGATEDSLKISIVICQKGHHTRLVFEETPGTFINPCPGLVVDSRGGSSSISSASINEFYLNSHAAIQGTAKPCKYALIHDEIGFKLSELELLTYWTCYLYARCNKSVSYATPAYYAHWASKRARYLVVGGASEEDLVAISSNFSLQGAASMFFI
jgi:eukaryotic translation initiation factor 2C